eukprot:CAMPEP_0202923868 /NCGR_PEP_ID=MMETSP1392-20130828/78673_1 /ASSEMBLY_ACC=CAM_ASM_000868 /TAXON_ID=225041 /ORGANISM="Chlamydomonas chlamydogama, Strain SAG 11-48b" /LENGTH=163 /DNA_ID=CAMNT_0049617567 /DNA_START=148 /DNA_END=639 /DNA_ORIENTATION=+
MQGRTVKAASLPHELTQLAEGLDPLAAAGTLGYIAGTLMFALYFVEKSTRGSMESELQLAKSKLDDQESRIKQLQADLDKESRNARDVEMYKRRIEEYTKDILKLERALEMKDGQLETFMVVAQRQIKYLEEQLKELQRASLKPCSIHIFLCMYTDRAAARSA